MRCTGRQLRLQAMRRSRWGVALAGNKSGAVVQVIYRWGAGSMFRGQLDSGRMNMRCAWWFTCVHGGCVACEGLETARLHTCISRWEGQGRGNLSPLPPAY